jgi:hypothetical protein
MVRIILILGFLISHLTTFGQESEERDYIFLTFELDRNKDMHGTFIYYWVAELDKYDKVDEYKEPEIYSIFLHEFFGNDQLESCCLGKNSDPYTVTTATSYDFPENYSAYLGELRDMVQNNRKKLQTIKKEWKDNHKETITVYGTVLRGKLCKCEFGGDRYITTGDQISFPTGEYELIENYWTEDKYNILFYDFAEFEYGNTDYRTNK